MNERTMSYLQDRFQVFYRSSPVDEPPDSIDREFAYIPWSDEAKPPMLRHRSHFDMEPLAETIADRAPQHVYYSSALYDNPAANSMNEKGWKGANLVFDLDADHFDDVNPATDTLAEMLHECHAETADLIDIISTDLGFSDLSVVFSGRRGFHVHVEDEGVKAFEKAERREMVDYVTAAGIEADEVVREKTIGGEFGQKSPTKRRFIDVDGGWGRRLWLLFLDHVDGLLAEGEDAVSEGLQELEGVGEKRATSATSALVNRRDQANTAVGDGDDGGLMAHPAIHTVFKRFVAQSTEATGAEIDEPVTTDARRLMRLPGSLHGGSGLVTTPIPLDEFDSFDPLTDAVPTTFQNGDDVSIEVSEATTTTVGGDERELSVGTHTVPQHVGIHLLTGGAAELDS